MEKFSVGTDIVEISRIRKSCQNKRFMERVYSEKEAALFLTKKDPYPSLAGNWAAKEAFSKALGTGVRGFELCEVSVLRDNSGAPYFEFTGKAKEIADSRKLDFSVSISHSKEYATAVVAAFSRK